MGLNVTASDVRELGPGLWRFEMPPHQVKLFGAGAKSLGSRSVLLIEKYKFDAQKKELQFSIDHVATINIGRAAEAIGIATDVHEQDTRHILGSGQKSKSSCGPGDQEFLRLARQELPEDMYKVAIRLLTKIRERFPGDLERGQSRNFFDTPDNFWYVIIQPRISQLSITVRGSVEHFQRIAKLEIKDDRGNTRFKVRSEGDVEAALDMIFHAKRKHK